MKNKYINECHESKTRLMAVSGPFQIELMDYVGTNDYKYLIEISKTLVKEYGEIALLTPNTIQTYFNKKNSRGVFGSTGNSRGFWRKPCQFGYRFSWSSYTS